MQKPISKKMIISGLKSGTKWFLLCALAAIAFGCSSKDAGHSLTALDEGDSGLTAEQHENLGDTAFRGGNHKLAYTHYAQALTAQPEDLNLHLKQGVLLLSEHQDDMALEEFKTVLKVEPDNAVANEGAGTVYFRTGLDDEARVSFERALAVNPSMWMSLNSLGVLHSRKGEYSRAIEFLHQALAVKPDADEVLNNLGLAMTMSGNFEGAVEVFGKALSLGVSDSRTYNNLGLVLARMGKYDKALQAFKMGGDESRAYNNLGYVLLLEGKPEQAASCFEKAISLSPTFYVKASENLVRARRAAAFRDINGQSEDAVLPLTGALMPVKPEPSPSAATASPLPVISPASFPESSSRPNTGAVPAVRPAAFGGRTELGSSSTALGTNAPPPAPGKTVSLRSHKDEAVESAGVVRVEPNAEAVPVSDDDAAPVSVSVSGSATAPEAAPEADSETGPVSKPVSAPVAVPVSVPVSVSVPEKTPTPAPTAEEESGLPRWGLHVSSWRKEAKAERVAEELRGRGMPAHVVRKDLAGKGVWYRVIAGEFESFEAADNRRRQIMETLKIKSSFVRKYFVPETDSDPRNA